MSHLSSEVPVINLSLLSKGNKEELMKLDLACKEWGFFQAIKNASAEFFALPLEEKNNISMPPDDVQGYGHAYVVSEEQTLDWSDALMMLVYPSRFRKLRFWPTEPKGYKQTIETYSTEVKKVAVELLGSLSLIMGMEKGALLELHKELGQALRVNYYPPCRMPDSVLGISPHSDAGTITILMQEDDVVGLQILHRGGWVPVNPLPNSLVVNVGDIIEILSNGKYKKYRAQSCDKPQQNKVRYGDYLRQSMKMKHDGKDHTHMAKIESQ
ncbi:Protein SRG1 [Morus notabilis]|uniref:Protein SRG1 n=1 Tax=Morus notabilis TaxID=981085 RepID=W9SKZ9_9ROSA|nr:Protein SRG1 [Morus notabilis]